MCSSLRLPGGMPSRICAARGTLLSQRLSVKGERVIEIAKTVNNELMDALARLMPQLTNMPLPTAAHLRSMLSDPDTRLFLVRDMEGAIAGMLTLTLYRVPSGTHAVIEDVVVDSGARGRGYGKLLTQAALEAARSMGAGVVDLTSRPSREAANRLYQRMGFTRRETNVYRYLIEDPQGSDQNR